MNILKRCEKAEQLWRIIGDFGILCGVVKKNNNEYIADNGKVRACSVIEKDESGVILRKGYVENISSSPVVLYTLSSKFVLDGGEYSVYTQYNAWQNESMGGWQPLVTTAGSRCESVRNASGAAPFGALFNEQSGKGVAFHLNALGAWEMRFSKIPSGGEASFVEAELGFLKDGFSYELLPGEKVELPEIWYYTVKNKCDLDCYKLHTYLNKKYPRKTMPVLYNTWLYKFDSFTFDDVMIQIEKAKELGVEYFVIDAGWFGKGAEWWRTRGDWDENLVTGFKGRMCEIADEVRRCGMKFGFWLEPETANFDTDIMKAHPEYFISENGSYFLDFANRDALEHIYGKTCELVDRYGAEFIKFDFNADLRYDKEHSAFIKYMRGHREYILRLKEKYPDLYMENCASGGYRFALRDGLLYDSFWLSDNQSPYEGLRIFKESVMRMAPQWIECWAVICSAKGVPPVYAGQCEYIDKLISCNDATWNSVAGVHGSFLKGFLTGSPIGFSCDLASIDAAAFEDLKKHIENFKNDREFMKNAVCHILSDTDSVCVFEFASIDYKKVQIVAFIKKARQDNLCVFPKLCDDAEYVLSNGAVKSSSDIEENGIDFAVRNCYTAQILTLEKK